jgi:glycogen operon protein
MGEGEDLYKDVAWLRPDGHEMTEEEWTAGWVRCIGLELSGRLLDHQDALGRPYMDDTFLILLNPHWEPIKFYVPIGNRKRHWKLILDTRTHEEPEPVQVNTGEYYEIIPRSMAVFSELVGD